MKRGYLNKQTITQVVLASTVFVAPVTLATDITVPTAGPIFTSAQTDNLITITATAQVIDGAPAAVNLDSPFGKVIVNPDNNFGTNGAEAIVSDLATGDIGLAITGKGGEVTIGSKSGISVFETGQVGVLVDAPDVTINNDGLIFANDSYAIQIDAVDNTHLINNLHGAIKTNASTVIYTDINSQGFQFDNSGLVLAPGSLSANAIELHGQFDAFINHSGGHITAPNILDGFSAILIADTGGTRFENQAGGWIDVTGNGNAIVVNAPVTTFINAGLIESQKNATIAVDVNGSIDTFENTGTIYARNLNTPNTDAAAVILQNGMTSFTNSGDIVSIDSTAPTIMGFGGQVVISDGFTNTGNIVNTSAGTVLDFQTFGGDAKVSIHQNDGLIVGQILLPQYDSDGGPNVFTLSGGMISAPAGIFASNGAIASSNHLLEGGEFQGSLFLSDQGDTVTLTGSTADRIIGGDGNDLFILKSGTFNLIHGNDGANKIQVPNTFKSTGLIENVQTIEVLNAGTEFTVGAYIHNLDNVLSINQNTSVVQQYPISGDGRIENRGCYYVEGNGIIDINTFTNFAGSHLYLGPTDTLLLNVPGNPNRFYLAPTAGLDVAIARTPTTNNFSKMVVTTTLNNGSSILLDTNSLIVPTFSGFIPEGSTYAILTLSSTGSVITDLSSIDQPASVIVSFTKALNAPQNDILTLTAHRDSYQRLSTSAASFGVAGTLDALAAGNGPTNLDLYYLLSQLDQLPTQHLLELSMESLTPPYHYGLIDGAHLAFNTLAENITDRVWDFAWDYRFKQTKPMQAPSGVNGGSAYQHYGVWGAPMGVYAEQRSREAISGYRVTGGGGMIGFDYAFNPCMLVGIAGSYFKTLVDDKHPMPKNEGIKSWQLTAYGSFSFDSGFYFDALAGYATNQYHINRVIGAHNLLTTAQADVDGNVWGVTGDLGYILSNCSRTLNAPFVRLRYIQLSIGDYVESGAGDLSLSVSNRDPGYFTGGVGWRAARMYPCGKSLWVPEFTALVGYDIVNQAEHTIANFIGGGPSFVTPGYLPSATYLDIGLGLNMALANSNILTFKYNLELRSQYYAQSGAVQLYWPWG